MQVNVFYGICIILVCVLGVGRVSVGCVNKCVCVYVCVHGCVLIIVS